MAALSLFYSYSHEDETLRNQLEKHLRQLQRQGLISGWHDREIPAGREWAHEIDTHLQTASIVLMLISPDFLASDYCYENEMQQALERHTQGLARVISIILRPCDWQHSPHFILRIFLWQQDDLPWDLVPFLDEAAERLLLRKIGGSYIFVHRQLSDYFAELAVHEN